MKTIKLMGIREQAAVEAKTIKKGDILIWNYGMTEKVLEIVKETKEQIVLLIECESGYKGTRRLLKNRLVAKANI